MIDLDDLEKKLDEALDKETLESLRSWLEGKRKNPLVKPVKCNNCQCTPSVIYSTPTGAFCESCRPATP